MRIVGNCAECAFFERGKWAKALDPDEASQLGGHCETLRSVLAMTNSGMWHMDKIHVQESFGCSLFRPVEDDKGKHNELQGKEVGG